MPPYYVSIGGQNFGPADPDELLKWHKSGSFQPTDFVWDEPSACWIEASRFIPIAGIFDPAPVPALGIEDVDELSRAPRDQTPAVGPESESFCSNHESSRATAICPQCRKSYCAQCMVTPATADVSRGITLCIDCVSSEKSAATKSPKRTMMLAGSVIAILGMTIGAYLFLATNTAVQPATLDRIEIKRGAPPVPLSGAPYSEAELTANDHASTSSSATSTSTDSPLFSP